MTFDPENLARLNIRQLVPYSSARHEFAGAAEIYLDANENAFGSPIGMHLNRYPDPLQTAMKKRLAVSKGISPAQIFIGNGSDEAIDLLFRVFCEPGREEAIICPPTYGMYKVAAEINGVLIKEIPLTQEFQLDVPRIQEEIVQITKLIFFCSPNNPTGNTMKRSDLLDIAKNFHGIVVVDEAYIDFSFGRSLLAEFDNYPNLVVLQTLSKAWGLAGARVGMAFANERIINLINLIKPPYNVSQLAQEAALDAFQQGAKVEGWVAQILEQRLLLADRLTDLDFIQKVYPSEANFLLVKVEDAETIYRSLLDRKIVVRDRSNVRLCEGCLRITVGTPEENVRLVEALKTYQTDQSADVQTNARST